VSGTTRKFDTGAVRDSDLKKLDYEGFFSPVVLKEFAKYMNKHRKQSDGKLRNSDNWQRGMPKDVYIKSMIRHLIDLWLEHRGFKSRDGAKEALNGLLFNVMGYYFEFLMEGMGK